MCWLLPSADPYCKDLTEDAASTSSDIISGLCTVCQQIDFVSPACVHVCPATTVSGHFHIGVLRHIIAKPFCPGCRLILSFLGPIESSDRAIGERRVTIRKYHLSPFREIAGDGMDNGWTKKYEEIDDDTISHMAPLQAEIRIDVTIDSGPGPGRNVGAIIRSERSESGDESHPAEDLIDSEGPAEEFGIRSRAVPSILNIDLVKHWMHLCDDQHTSCRRLDQNQEALKRHKIRLVDVKEQKVISASQAERYVALSYVWGSNTKPLLKRDSITRYSAPNSLSGPTIPQTILDALLFVRNIGERYLWIDTLCIVQDDDSDKLPQLSIMDSIYNNAYLVIVAAAGCDAHFGLSGIGTTERRSWQQGETINGVQFMTAQPSLIDALEWSTWNQRGWTFQEAMMARRTLTFTREQVYWNCRAQTWREDVTCESPAKTLRMDLSNSFRSSNCFMRTSCRTREYCMYVEKFSGRRFKENRDALWAFTGILDMLKESRFQQGFKWGLPYERLDATLLWSESDQCSWVHKRSFRHSTYCPNKAIKKSPLHLILLDGGYYRPKKPRIGMDHDRYPSWSWLSTESKVTYGGSCGDSIISEISWDDRSRSRDINPAKYFNSSYTQGLFGNNVDQQADTLVFASAFKKVIKEYKLLQFTAQAADLRVICNANDGKQQISGLAVIQEYTVDANNTATGPRQPPIIPRKMEATIHIPSGEGIGTVELPDSFFDGKKERFGELILLSSNAAPEYDETCKAVKEGHDYGNIMHSRGCEHIESHNVMLIEWKGDIARRRGLGTVSKEGWGKVETCEKHITLG